MKCTDDVKSEHSEHPIPPASGAELLTNVDFDTFSSDLDTIIAPPSLWVLFSVKAV